MPTPPTHWHGELLPHVDGALLPARLRLVLARADADPAAAEQAAAALAAAGARLDAAEAFAIAATVHRQARDEAATRLAVARAAELELECEGALTEGLLAFREGIEALTDREREVASLVATGLASREVAEQLSLSTRTVDNLLGRVYRKLDIPGRPGLMAVFGATPAVRAPATSVRRGG